MSASLFEQIKKNAHTQNQRRRRKKKNKKKMSNHHLNAYRCVFFFYFFFSHTKCTSISSSVIHKFWFFIKTCMYARPAHFLNGHRRFSNSSWEGFSEMYEKSLRLERCQVYFLEIFGNFPLRIEKNVEKFERFPMIFGILAKFSG